MRGSKDIDPVELARSVVFFVIIWTVAQYVRGELFGHLDGFVEGAGKVAGLVFALGLGVLKFISWRKARRSEGFASRAWRALPWIVGVAAPAVYVIIYIATDDAVGLMYWISLVTELLVPVAALLVAYTLLSKIFSERGTGERALVEATTPEEDRDE